MGLHVQAGYFWERMISVVEEGERSVCLLERLLFACECCLIDRHTLCRARSFLFIQMAEVYYV
jgi:hypothetical protein